MINKISDWIKEYAKIKNCSGYFVNTNEYLSNKFNSFGLQNLHIKSFNEKDAISYCDDNNLLAISTLDKINYRWIRPYKRFLLIADVLPFGNMVQSEIRNFIDFNYYNYSLISQQESEWVNLINQKIRDKYNIGIIDSLEDPSKNSSWFIFSPRQKEIISKLNSSQKETLKKHVELPVYRIQ
jgi:hypothetical protein